jgi:hypothetical protein
LRPPCAALIRATFISLRPWPAGERRDSAVIAADRSENW